MTALPKASPLSGLPGTGPSAPNADETTISRRYSVKHPTNQRVVNRITRQLAIWANASRKAWRTRKRLEAARAAGKGEP